MGRTAETLVGAAVRAAAGAVGGIQGTLRLQPRPRGLTPAEAEALRRVYRGSLDLSRIRIVEGAAGLFSLSARPFALGDFLYMKKVDLTRRLDVLVHEACHAWQNQREGSRYIGGALIAQATKGRAAYDWRLERRAGKAWVDFNREAQAQLIQDVFRWGGRGGSFGDGTFFEDEPLAADVFFHFDGEDMTQFARDSVEALRSAAVRS
jgi:hypothetical protein